MRIDILINGNAGRANQLEIETRVRRVLFRCELHFHAPGTIESMRAVIESAAEAGSDYLIVSGGDGTLNACLAPLIKRYHSGLRIPPVCLVPVGTANDLAFTLNTPRRIERAARAILEGKVDNVNVLEITSAGKTAHMITNGGLGIPAETAENANRLRSWVKREARNPSTSANRQRIFKLGEKIISRAGPKIYEVLLIRDLARWDSESWELELEIEGCPSIRTQAPFILFNNQPSLAGGILTAPLTSHADGKFNVLLGHPTRLFPQVKAIWDMRQGRVPNPEDCPSYETPALKLRVSEKSRPLTFFGDGEILHKDVREISVRCLHPGIPFVRMPL
jgi:diacylglycerol kinase family enzyme